MAGAAEGVWLDSESIHPSPPVVRAAGFDSTGRRVTRDFQPSPRKPSSLNLDICLRNVTENSISQGLSTNITSLNPDSLEAENSLAKRE
jgi:hypothetical protein